jgi:hypothetical protein
LGQDDYHTKNHESFDEPPDLPSFSAVQLKKASLAEAITGAAPTFASVARTPDVSQCNNQSALIAPSSPKASATPVATAAMGISPGKVAKSLSSG